MKNSNPNSSGGVNACISPLALVGACVNLTTNLPVNQACTACLTNGYKWVEGCIPALWASQAYSYDYEVQTLCAPSLGTGYICTSSCSNSSYTGSNGLTCTQNGGNWTTICSPSNDPDLCSNGLEKCNGACCGVNQICSVNGCCDNCNGQCCGSNQTCINGQCLNYCNSDYCSMGGECINSECCYGNNICGGTCCADSETCAEGNYCEDCGDMCGAGGWSTLLHCDNKICCNVKDTNGKCSVQCLPSGNQCYQITQNGTNCQLDSYSNYYCCPEGWQKLESDGYGLCCPQNTTACGSNCCSSNEKCTQDYLEGLGPYGPMYCASQ